VKRPIFLFSIVYFIYFIWFNLFTSGKGCKNGLLVDVVARNGLVAMAGIRGGAGSGAFQKSPMV
jgi:hypothetical protein